MEDTEDKMDAQCEFVLLMLFQLWYSTRSPLPNWLNGFPLSFVSSSENVYQRNKVCISTSLILLKAAFSYIGCYCFFDCRAPELSYHENCLHSVEQVREGKKGLLLSVWLHSLNFIQFKFIFYFIFYILLKKLFLV